MRESISVVIPAYNEETRIVPTLKRINAYCKKQYRQYEIIIVDDGSSDRTAELAESYGSVIKHKTNQGKGAAVKIGMLAAKHARILFSDSDLATPIEELEKLERALDTGADIAIASRNLPESDVKTTQPFYRKLMGKLFAKIVKIVAIKEYTDTQCGFKLFTRNAARDIFIKTTINDYTFDVEVLCIAKQQGYAVQEVPVVWIDQPGSKIRPIKDSFHMLKQLLRVRRARNNFIPSLARRRP